MDSKLSRVTDGHLDEDGVMKNHLIRFVEAALAHTEAILDSDHRKANRNHDIAKDSVACLKHHGELLQLRQFLSHPSEGVRIWAATHLLPTESNQEAISTLNIVAQGHDLIALDARTVLSEWTKGTLML